MAIIKISDERGYDKRVQLGAEKRKPMGFFFPNRNYLPVFTNLYVGNEDTLGELTKPCFLWNKYLTHAFVTGILVGGGPKIPPKFRCSWTFPSLALGADGSGSERKPEAGFDTPEAPKFTLEPGRLTTK